MVNYCIKVSIDTDVDKFIILIVLEIWYIISGSTKLCCS